MDKNWFEVRKLPNNVYAIMEPHHFQEVISYLVVGSEKNLLLDTGAGLSSIRDVVSELSDKKLVVVNSHAHFDHVGNNYMFDEVLIYDDHAALERLRRGYSRVELAPQAGPELFEPGYSEYFDLENYFIMPSNPVGVEDGHMIDLGDRKIKVIHTPGHSPDSVMLLDIDNRILFTGDTYYPGHLYAHYEGEFYGNSDIEAYAASMRNISKLCDGLVSIHPSHNEPICNPQILKKAASAFQKLAERDVSPGMHLYGDLSVASLPNSGECVAGYVIPDDLYIYDFDGLKIIARKRHD
jgi:glyoxylase-like metal-dependent hydrolase (beta-lactamase superfamily II)